MAEMEDLRKLLKCAYAHETDGNEDPVKAAEFFGKAAIKADSLPLLGPHHAETLDIRDSWANSLLEAQYYPAAIVVNLESLKRRSKSNRLGRTDMATRENLRRLAQSYIGGGKRGKGIEQYRALIQLEEGLDDSAELFGDVCTLVCELFDFGLVAKDRTLISEAFEISIQYLKKAEKELPGDDMVVLDFYYNIGRVLRQLDRQEEAIDWFDQIIKIIASLDEDRTKSKQLEELLRDSETERSRCVTRKEIQDLKPPNKAKPAIRISGTSSAKPQLSVTRSAGRSEVAPESRGQTDRPHAPWPASPAPWDKAKSETSVRRSFDRDLRVGDGTEHGRSSSVPPARTEGQLLGDNITSESERWLRGLRKNAHSFLGKERQSPESRKDIRIALLDTGVALNNPEKINMSVEARSVLRYQVRKGKQVHETLRADEDVDGHGSDCAYLLARTCPFAQIISYRIVESQEGDKGKGRRKDDGKREDKITAIDPSVVAEALSDAIRARKVDIISMSFGCRDPDDRIRELLHEARGKGILMFAASGNDGDSIKFPASDDHVFAIDGAEAGGGRFSNNAETCFRKLHRFTALGRILSVHGSKGEKTGSSFATPVAAATAAVVLEFASQLPLACDPRILKNLKRMEGMRAVLIQLFSTTKERVSDFHHIRIDHFEAMNYRDGWEQGGEWFDIESVRYGAALRICDALDDPWLREDLGKTMKSAVSKESMGRMLKKMEAMRPDLGAWLNDWRAKMEAVTK